MKTRSGHAALLNSPFDNILLNIQYFTFINNNQLFLQIQTTVIIICYDWSSHFEKSIYNRSGHTVLVKLKRKVYRFGKKS